MPIALPRSRLRIGFGDDRQAARHHDRRADALRRRECDQRCRHPARPRRRATSTTNTAMPATKILRTPNRRRPRRRQHQRRQRQRIRRSKSTARRQAWRRDRCGSPAWPGQIEPSMKPSAEARIAATSTNAALRTVCEDETECVMAGRNRVSRRDGWQLRLEIAAAPADQHLTAGRR